jgi:hypothetical protein
MKVDFTKTDLQILYPLLNGHLNMIGEIDVTLLKPGRVSTSEDYLYRMEMLEHKIAAAAFGLKPK